MKFLNPDWITTSLAIFNLFGTTLVLKLSDIYGRRRLLLLGSISIGIVLTIAGLFQIMSTDADVEAIIVLFIWVYIFLYSVSFGPISWVYAAEIMEDKGLGLYTSFNWLFILIISISMPFIINAITDP